MPWLGQAVTAYGPVRAGPVRMLRYARFDQYLQRHHFAGPHYYLWFLGVDPRLQNRGFGSALLRKLERLADQSGVASYLETDRESSVRLYLRHGFEITHQQAQDRYGFTMWHMTRKPRDARAQESSRPNG